MSNQQLDAYKVVEKATLSGRDLEASVLTRAAYLIADVQHSWDAPHLDERLDNALRFNQKVWTLFQAELSNPDNLLPIDIKNNLLSLSVFVDKRTFEAMAYPDSKKLDILVSINKNIAAGLRGESGT